MREPEPLTRERLRALASEMVAVVRRHSPDWTAPAEHDPGSRYSRCSRGWPTR
jgi:hypothetical protein